jgi:hypothetical protein
MPLLLLIRWLLDDTVASVVRHVSAQNRQQRLQQRTRNETQRGGLVVYTVNNIGFKEDRAVLGSTGELVNHAERTTTLRTKYNGAYAGSE